MYFIKGPTRIARHDVLCHPGGDRLWKTMISRYEFADMSDAKRFTKDLTRRCATCKACRPIYRSKLGIDPTIVHSTVMTHVSIDIFFIARTEYDGDV